MDGLSMFSWFQRWSPQSAIAEHSLRAVRQEFIKLWKVNDHMAPWPNLGRWQSDRQQCSFQMCPIVLGLKALHRRCDCQEDPGHITV